MYIQCRSIVQSNHIVIHINYLLQEVNRICTGKPNQCTYYTKIGRPITIYYWQYGCIAVTQIRMKRTKQTAKTEGPTGCTLFLFIYILLVLSQQ